MATSPRAFLIELYEEYLLEASFLYEQRRTLFHNPEVSWKKIAEFEDRLEAHIDGLVVGEKLALDVCQRHATEGDFGELFAAVCVFCRQKSRDLTLSTLEQLDPEDPGKAVAVADALKYELPDEWVQDLLLLLNSGNPKLAPVLARAFGYRRVPCGPQLMSSMKRCAAPALSEVIWALGRVHCEAANEQIFDYLKTEDTPVRSAAALALLRTGDWRAAQFCIDEARSKAWPVLPIGLSGSRRALNLIMELAAAGPRVDCITTIGLLGDPVSTQFLISALENSETAAAASTALECMTGAGLYETAFIPDEVDEDELFESEREQLRRGKPLDRGDGRPFGTNVTRLSQKPDDWNRWWRANSGRFTPGVRYRNGATMSPQGLIEMLAAERTPHDLRAYCAEEIVTNYGKDIGFETDMPAKRQMTLLSDFFGSAQSFSRQFREGEWYCAGSPS
jgi:uncharacterized protein (TIGR02270 family)